MAFARNRRWSMGLLALGATVTLYLVYDLTQGRTEEDETTVPLGVPGAWATTHMRRIAPSGGDQDASMMGNSPRQDPTMSNTYEMTAKETRRLMDSHPVAYGTPVGGKMEK